MKKSTSYLNCIVLAVLLFLAFAAPLMAATGGTCTVTNITSAQLVAVDNRIPESGTVIVTATCTGNSVGGTFANTAIPVSGYYPQNYLNVYNITGYYLYQVGRTPGTTQPTANYTVTLTDADSFALDLGLLTSNGSASAAQLNVISNTTTNYPVIRSALTLAITGNSVASANIVIDLIFKAF